MVEDKIGWKAKWTVYKWGEDPENAIAQFLQAGGKIEDAIKVFGVQPIVESFEGNVALNEGLQLLIDIITGIDTTSAKWDSSNAHIGVGDGTTAEDASQTGLQGSNKTYLSMDSNYPQRSNQTAEWRATADGNTANHGWQEFTVANGSDDTATNLNRKVADKGTKASGETWTAVMQITFS